MNAEQRAALPRLDQQFDAIRAMPEPIPGRDRYRHGVEELRAGDYLRVLASEGAELCRVESVSAYRDKSSTWYELELLGLESGRARYVEWEKDDEIEVSINGSELSLRELGVTADQVEEMSEEESGHISFGGRRYEYDDDYGATYYRDGDTGGGGESVYFYDFETRDERYGLTVEEWGSASEGYEYAAFVCEFAGPESIEVVALASRDAGPAG